MIFLYLSCSRQRIASFERSCISMSNATTLNRIDLAISSCTTSSYPLDEDVDRMTLLPGRHSRAMVMSHNRSQLKIPRSPTAEATLGLRQYSDSRLWDCKTDFCLDHGGSRLLTKYKGRWDARNLPAKFLDANLPLPSCKCSHWSHVEAPIKPPSISTEKVTSNDEDACVEDIACR